MLEHISNDYDCVFLDDGDQKVVDGVMVIGKIERIKALFPEYKYLLVTIGDNKLRERVYKEAAEIGYSFPNLILPSAYVSPNAMIGNGVIIMSLYRMERSLAMEQS